MKVEERECNMKVMRESDMKVEERVCDMRVEERVCDMRVLRESVI